MMCKCHRKTIGSHFRKLFYYFFLFLFYFVLNCCVHFEIRVVSVSNGKAFIGRAFISILLLMHAVVWNAKICSLEFRFKSRHFSIYHMKPPRVACFSQIWVSISIGTATSTKCVCILWVYVRMYILFYVTNLSKDMRMYICKFNPWWI